MRPWSYSGHITRTKYNVGTDGRTVERQRLSNRTSEIKSIGIGMFMKSIIFSGGLSSKCLSSDVTV